MTVTLLAGLAVVVVVTWVLIRGNGLVRLRNRLDNAWAQIDVQLARRHQVVASLLDTFPAEHRREVVGALERARLRVGARPPERAAAEADLIATLARAPAGAGPSSHLTAELAAVEAQIVHASAHHDETVRRYSTRRGPGPSALVARALGAGPRQPFTDPHHRPVVLGLGPAIREQRSA